MAFSHNHIIQALKGGETMAKNKRCRSAITGKFVKESYANSHPKTTIKETVKSLSISI